MITLEKILKSMEAKRKGDKEMKLDAFIHKHLRRGLKYACVGTSGFLMDVGILYVLTQYGHIWYITSEVLATLITFVTNYFFNTYWTYRDAMKKLDAKNTTAKELNIKR
jgi:putative flippase GtrA